jgi:hypothetical protein
MVDMTAIGVISTSLNTLVNITRAMSDVRDATVFQGKVFELQRAIIDAQQNIFVQMRNALRCLSGCAHLKMKLPALKTGMQRSSAMN